MEPLGILEDLIVIQFIFCDPGYCAVSTVIQNLAWPSAKTGLYKVHTQVGRTSQYVIGTNSVPFKMHNGRIAELIIRYSGQKICLVA